MCGVAADVKLTEIPVPAGKVRGLAKRVARSHKAGDVGIPAAVHAHMLTEAGRGVTVRLPEPSGVRLGSRRANGLGVDRGFRCGSASRCEARCGPASNLRGAL